MTQPMPPEPGAGQPPAQAQISYGVVTNQVPGPDGTTWVQLAINFTVGGYPYAAGVFHVPPSIGPQLAEMLAKQLTEECRLASLKSSGFILPGMNGANLQGPPPGHPG